MDKQIGFIGLGIMGLPMAHNLQKGGFTLTVYNRTRSKCADLHEAGVAIASSPLEVGKSNAIVILMLTGPEAIDTILWGEQGLLGEGSVCRTLVNMSTVAPAYTKELDEKLKARGVTLIDAPVSGSRKPAQDATLVILAGGLRKDVESLEDVLLKIGKKVIYCGETGNGSRMKMVVNLLLCAMVSGLSEALVLGERSGLSKELIMETVLAGPLGCGLFTLKRDMLLTGDYPVQFPLKHMYKDLNCILQTAGEVGATAKIGETLQTLYAAGMEQGLADLDFAAVKRVISQ